MNQAERADFVERMARAIEEGGESRITGRIYAHLATSDTPHMSLQQLATELGISKGSVSMNTRRLIYLDLLERAAVPGARGEHYRLTPTGPDALLAAAAARARRLAVLAEEGIAMQKGSVTPGTQSLRAMREAYIGVATAIEGKPRKRAAR